MEVDDLALLFLAALVHRGCAMHSLGEFVRLSAPDPSRRAAPGHGMDFALCKA